MPEYIGKTKSRKWKGKNPFKGVRKFKRAWKIGQSRKAQCRAGFKSMCK